MSKHKEIKDLEKHLLYKNKETYDNIVFYIGSRNLDCSELDEIKLDVLEIALNAQQRGETFSEAIGNDIKNFCDQLIEVSNKKSRVCKIKDVLLNALLIVDFYIVLSLLMNAVIDLNNLMIFTMGHLIFVIISFFEFKVVLNVLKNKAVRKQKGRNKVYLEILSLLIIVLSGVLFVKFYDVVLFKFSILSLIVITLVTILCQIIIKGKK